MKSDPDQRQEEQEVAGDVAGPAKPDRRRQVEFGRGMMDAMRGPHPADAVGGAMLPVELAAEKQPDKAVGSPRISRTAGTGRPMRTVSRRQPRWANEVLHDRDAERRSTLPPVMRLAMHEAGKAMLQRHEAEAVIRIRPRKSGPGKRTPWHTLLLSRYAGSGAPSLSAWARGMACPGGAELARMVMGQAITRPPPGCTPAHRRS